MFTSFPFRPVEKFSRNRFGVPSSTLELFVRTTDVASLSRLLDEESSIPYIDMSSSGGLTCLFNCASLGAVEAINFLLDHKPPANVNRRDRYGNSALHFAVQGRQAVAVAALLAGGGDPRLRNLNGDSPIDLALRHGLEDIAGVLRGVQPPAQPR